MPLVFQSGAVQGGSRGVAYGNGLWAVAGSMSGGWPAIYRSTNGTAWTAQQFGTTFVSMMSLAYGDGLWLTGAGSNIARSTDAVSWSSVASPVGLVDGFARGGGMWVAIGSDGVASSPDGVTWTSRGQVLGGSAIRGVAYRPGLFVVVGQGGKIATSPDGISWTLRDSGVPDKYLLAVATDGTKFAALATDGSIGASADGISWQWNASIGFFTGSTGTLIYGGGRWVAGGSLGRMAASWDAQTWTLIESGIIEASNSNVYAIAYGGNDEYVVVTHPSPQLSFGTIDLPAATPGEDIDLPWAVEVLAGLAWPVAVASNATEARLPWPVALGAPASVSLGWPVSAIDPAVVAGLDGAGGWAPAPDGRWQAVVVLGDDDISARLVGEIDVACADDEARTAQFSFKPAAAIQPLDLIGRRVRVAFAQRTASGPINAQLMFSGVVDVPEIDAATGLVTCRCTDQMQEIFTNTPREWIDATVGGRWHEAVSGAPADNWDYLQARLKSVPRSIALDALQRPCVLPWRELPRGVTIRRADFVDGSLSVELPSRHQLRTRITCRMQYRYPRLRLRGIVAGYGQPFSFYAWRGVNGALRSRRWLLSSMVQGAAGSLSGWTLAGPVAIEHPRPGTYLTRGQYDGAVFIRPEVAPDLALAFSARYTTRWVQAVTESLAVTLVLPALEAALGGPVGEEMGANLAAEFQQPEWTRDGTVEPVAPAGAPFVGDRITPWQPAGADQDARDEVLRTLLDQAWVRLWAANRTGRVSLALPLRPDLWLDVWATVEAGTVRAAGKIAALTHRMNVERGEAVTELSIAVGLPGNLPAAHPEWTLPAVQMPDETRPLSAYSAQIGTFVGGEPGSPPFDAETMIGFATNVEMPGTDESLNWYPHQISMRAPEIEARDRDPLEVAAEALIETAIPTDLLEIDPS